MKPHGILPAIVTPLTADGQLHTKSLEQLITRMYEAGSHGLYVCGNTGEGMQLPPALREKAAEVAKHNSPTGKQVIIHVGAPLEDDALRLTRHASRLGVSAISSLPPGPAYNFAETHAWYQTLAVASSVPFLVYHFPALSQPMSIDQLDQLCRIPNVIGLKFTSFDLYTLRQVLLSGATIFNGHDEVLAAGLLMGAQGGIGSTYNLMADLFVRLYHHATNNEWAEAIALQDRINALIRILLRYPLIPAIKLLLNTQGLDCGQAVSPRAGLTPDQQSTLLSDFQNWHTTG
jgi:N-acetylneuraminate lyase